MVWFKKNRELREMVVKLVLFSVFLFLIILVLFIFVDLKIDTIYLEYQVEELNSRLKRMDLR